jgi:selenocysteine-specific elongation factor
VKLDEPVILLPGDRFVLRQPTPVATIGGGCVLDCHPASRQRKSETAAWLEQAGRAAIPEQLLMRVKRRAAAGIRVAALARESGLTSDAARQHLQSAMQARDVVAVAGDLLVSREGTAAASAAVMDCIARLAADRAATRIRSSELRSQTGLIREVFEFVMSRLVAEGKLRIEGEDVWPAGKTEGSAAVSGRMAQVAQAYETAGLAAPTVPELVQRFRLGEAEMRRIITVLQRQKTIVRMGSDDLFIHARALEALAGRMAPLRGTLIDVTAFKQMTGLSRKFAIPLLEYLDHARVTRKQGEGRVVL